MPYMKDDITEQLGWGWRLMFRNDLLEEVTMELRPEG